jgi:phytol kinase
MLPCLYLFEHWYWAISLPLVFVGLNLLGQRRPPLAFEDQEKCGPVYFPISFVILISLFWDWPVRWVAGAGILIMAWADAGAALVGERWGRHRFSLFGARKSIEGSLTMLGLSFLTCWFVFGFLARFPIPLTLSVSSAVSLVATGMEALSGRGLDNITVPLSSALVSYLILFASG